MNKVKIIALGLVVLFFIIGGMPLNAMKREYKSISFEGMYKLVETFDEYYILDVRTEEEYASGHAKGAILSPLDEIEKVEYDKEVPIFVYCRSGVRSNKAALELVKKGYKNVYDVGGIINYNFELEY